MALMESLNVLCDGFNHTILLDCFSVLKWLLVIDIDQRIIMGRKYDKILCIVDSSSLYSTV